MSAMGERRLRRAYVGGIGFDSQKQANRVAAKIEEVADFAYQRAKAESADEIGRLCKEVEQMTGLAHSLNERIVAEQKEAIRCRRRKREEADRASRAEAKVEEMAKALRSAKAWLEKANQPGDIGCDFLNEGGFDEAEELERSIDAALSQRSEIEPGRPAADAPKENRNG